MNNNCKFNKNNSCDIYGNYDCNTCSNFMDRNEKSMIEEIHMNKIHKWKREEKEEGEEN